MKLFLIGLGHMREDQIDVARLLQKKHTIQYWVRMRGHFTIDEAGKFKDTTFHEYTDALKALPADGIDVHTFEPLGQKEIAVYSQIESEFMTMADKWYPEWSVNHRKDLYYDMLRYWSGILEQFKPDCILFIGIPHEMYSFVLYAIAKRRNVKTLIVENTFDNDHYAIFEDYTRGSEELSRWKEGGDKISLDDLSPKMRTYYERVSKGEDPAPVYVKEYRDTYAKRNVRRWIDVSKRFVKDKSIVERSVMKIFKMMRPSLADEHRKNERDPDFNTPYVYFPLHYQPEGTTSPAGGVYVDQMLAIETLAAALPRSWKLYVKEHGIQLVVHHGNFTPARYPGFYDRIARIPNVRLIPMKTNTFTLIDRAQTTATIAGTAARESTLRGKTGMVFGYPWYMHAPGIFRVASVQDCKHAFSRIMEGFSPNESDIFKFLDCVDRTSLPGDVVRVTPHSKVNDYAGHMYNGIEEKLRAL